MRGLLVACALGLLAPPPAAVGSVVVYTLDVPHIVAADFTDMPAAFGARLPDDGLRGLLVMAAPRDGCDPLASPPDNDTDKWVVLIARYNCSFETKIRNAQAAGFICAIVHNVNSSDIDTMTAKDPVEIKIPSVFVSSAAGDELGEKYLYSKGYYIIVNGTPFDINTQLLLPFAIVVAICLFIMIGLMIVKCVRDRRHARRRRLPSRALKKIPTCKFSKGDPYDTCAICLDDYVEGERLRVLPCAHAYHCACIDPWLTQSRRVCPVCKRRVLAAGERRRAPSDSDSDDSRTPLAPAVRPTQGGTFEPQRENPFVRAARFVRRQRRASGETGQHRDEENNSTSAEEETGQHDESQPLILPVEAPVAQRRLRLFWPTRRRAALAAPAAPSPAPPPPPPPLPPPPLSASPPAALLPHSAEHSINTEARGEIGVAALPANMIPPPQINL